MTHTVSVPAPAYRPRIEPLGTPATLSPQETLALEAFADTVIPGRKRGPDDIAIAGVSDTPGAVECGALTVLTDPATGVEDGIAGMAQLVDERAISWARENGQRDVARFADLDYRARRALVTELTDPKEPQKDLWFLVALFSTMAYDSAPHLETVDALDPSKTPASGLRDMGFRPPREGRWVFRPASYGRAMARLHPDTDDNGDPR